MLENVYIFRIGSWSNEREVMYNIILSIKFYLRNNTRFSIYIEWFPRIHLYRTNKREIRGKTSFYLEQSNKSRVATLLPVVWRKFSRNSLKSSNNLDPSEWDKNPPCRFSLTLNESMEPMIFMIFPNSN